MLNIDNNDVHQCDAGWVPVFVDQEQKLCAMSIAFLLGSKDDAIVWRGPKKNGMMTIKEIGCYMKNRIHIESS